LAIRDMAAVLAKAKGGATIAGERVDHLRRYGELFVSVRKT
jgi:hypothetical protein